MSLPNSDSRRKLKILLLLLYYYPHSTGLTYYVQLIAEALAERGHQVTVLCARHAEETPLGESELNGVRVVRLWAPIRISRGMIMPSYPWRLIGLLRQHDVVNVHIPLLESAMVAFLARIAGVQVVATHHADLILPRSTLNDLITKFMYKIYEYTARRVPCIIGYSDDNAQHSFYLSPFREKVRTIYPPTVIPEPDSEQVRKLQAEWRNEGGPLIAFCGRFAQEKRPDLLIRSLEMVNRKFPKARVVFAGEQHIPYEDTWHRFSDLVAEYRSQLTFLGLLSSKQELANFYAACDVLVVPSDIEVFALVQSEAMLCGTPVVTTDIYGGRVAVSVTGMGKLAQKGDWRSLASAIIEVLEAPEKFVLPREYIADIFSFEDTVDQYEAIFREYAKD